MSSTRPAQFGSVSFRVAAAAFISSNSRLTEKDSLLVLLPAAFGLSTCHDGFCVTTRGVVLEAEDAAAAAGVSRDAVTLRVLLRRDKAATRDATLVVVVISSTRVDAPAELVVPRVGVSQRDPGPDFDPDGPVVPVETFSESPPVKPLFAVPILMRLGEGMES